MLNTNTNGDTGPAQGPITAGMVAAYIAKYATKAAEDFGLDNKIRSAAAAHQAGLRPHIAAMILTAEHLGGLDQYAGLHRWLHMLGFRGHFTTKSRRFSVTLGSLRDHQAARHHPDPPAPGGSPDPVHPPTGHHHDDHDGDESTVVVGQWRFLGLGYTTAGDALLAAYAHADHQHARTAAREQHRTEHGHDHPRTA